MEQTEKSNGNIKRSLTAYLTSGSAQKMLKDFRYYMHEHSATFQLSKRLADDMLHPLYLCWVFRSHGSRYLLPVPLQHGGTLLSRQAASHLERLVEGKERRETLDGVLPQNWGGTELNCTITVRCSRLRTTTGVHLEVQPVSCSGNFSSFPKGRIRQQG
ncbi:hypothetical protein TNCV_4568091 [Trichonephila clavipes]|nr:hypothetical protein TNCV_4568091 [Trichonephila clavipes]